MLGLPFLLLLLLLLPMPVSPKADGKPPFSRERPLPWRLWLSLHQAQALLGLETGANSAAVRPAFPPLPSREKQGTLQEHLWETQRKLL